MDGRTEEFGYARSGIEDLPAFPAATNQVASDTTSADDKQPHTPPSTTISANGRMNIRGTTSGAPEQYVSQRTARLVGCFDFDLFSVPIKYREWNAVIIPLRRELVFGVDVNLK